MSRFFFVFLILIAIDFYVFRTFQNQLSSGTNFVRYLVYSIFWTIPLMLIILSYLAVQNNQNGSLEPGNLIFYIATSFIVLYLPKIFIGSFQLVEDITKFIAWVLKSISRNDSVLHLKSNLYLKSFLIGRIGLIVALIPFVSLIYGVAHGRFNFEVKNVVIPFHNLPKEFDGFKIVQFSDFHAGSLNGNQENFKKAFDLINKQNADIIVFTGDMVNNKAKEVIDWMGLFSGLEAKNGKFSILGNHDYGDYGTWPSEEAKIANLDSLKQYHKKMGFNLLLNQSHIFERNGQSIALLGVENWGEKPFPQHGRLDLALAESKNIPFKVLLSHDPSHWDHEVKGKTDIALTLSGHTHGMQIAINFGSFSWSPVSIKYPRWKGLYKENNQYLYVNIGLGYIGYLGRVGTNPEITVFELKCE